ncbi:glycosyltransferase family 2 protein [Ectothiorhodospira shaposhnikovii]|uniref:glycosyltransferase family 2 protein n=1 Tax=Ectothiorhodospira shaposhnikovii TaxID=1054 RepID=UPI00399EEDA5
MQLEGIDRLRRCLGLLREPVKCVAVCHSLEPLGQGSWNALRDNPHMILRDDLPWAGWHMLELALSHERHVSTACLWVDYGSGFSEADSFLLQVKSGRMAKRLVYFPKRPKRLRLCPVRHAGQFSIEAFRLAWLSPWFAHKRLLRRLCGAHPQWRGRDVGEVLAGLRDEAGEVGVPFREWLWYQYDQTFRRRCTQADYAVWLAHHPISDERGIRRRIREVDGALGAMGEPVDGSTRPFCSVILPVIDPDPPLLIECLDSVLSQHFQDWELCIAVAASAPLAVYRVLDEYANREARIRLMPQPERVPVDDIPGRAMAMAQGRFVAMLGQEDCLTAEALLCVAELVAAHPDVLLIYSDEDCLNVSGERVAPCFKPAWNPDLALSRDYVGHLTVFERRRLLAVGGLRAHCGGGVMHDLLLRFVRDLPGSRIHHVPRVLYHRRLGQGGSRCENEAHDMGLRVVSEAVALMSPLARVEPGRVVRGYRVRWPLPDPAPLVSLVIPTRDRVDVLRPCVDALLARTRYPNFEVLVVDNASRCPRTLAYLSHLRRDHRVRVLGWHRPFNFSAINNFAVGHARGTVIGLINNDIEPINGDWLEEMVSQACRPEIGCVGAKLYYPGGRIQHGGVILGMGVIAGHAHRHLPGDAAGYCDRLQLVQNLSAVTAACLVMRREVFDEVGGFDECNLPVAFNDVDLCLKVREAGYRNLWTPYAEAYHHESASRGEEKTPEKRRRLEREIAYMRRRWGRELDHDPAYNPNLTLAHEDFSLR